MKVLVLAANGQIAKIVEQRILTEEKFKDVSLTLVLRNSQRLAELADNSRVTLVEGDISDPELVNKVMNNQDLVYVAVVDHGANNDITKTVISAMDKNNVKRVISTSLLGLYNEVPGEFGRWNLEMVKSGLPAAINADKLLAESGLDYTTLRLPWLNDRDEVKYTVTTKDEPYVGVSGSRHSIADVVLKIIADPKYGVKDSLGIADPDTQGLDRPVY
ncbi:NAD(P)H-binding protein [Lentilactobacillus kosonis]|uniref:Saccharopine dehydrogenase related protein n=1 Tax=Lentilactobacillus kosonis TaxID=2810561 RepID=A0A401FHX9_9LACO|nr:NAD(P)H-binding protein [Lentilactobacillus kosonis]GAY71861.1 saccharopine dehydrogenase related protein [Lentilactobacillus kosonis]